MQFQIVNRNFLDIDQNEKMFQIYAQSSNKSREDFNQKREAIDSFALYFDKSREIIGFSGIRNRNLQIKKKKVSTFYINQTVMLPEFQGKSLIQKMIANILLTNFISNPFRKIVVWNDSLSYRPLMLVAHNLKSYIPQPRT